MRPRTEFLHVAAMPWAETPAPGLFTRLLTQDPETGAHTSMYWLSPDNGYQPPTCAHYHHTYEEILPLSGSFSFDSRLWMEPGGYVYHPSFTVHGFKSAIRAESRFLSRIGRTLDFNYVEAPAQDTIYLVDGSVPSRAPVAQGDAAAAIGWRNGRFLGAPAEICPLSQDGRSGEGSALVRLAADWRGQAASLPHEFEIFVRDGHLAGNVGAVGSEGYFCIPPGEPVPALSAPDGATLFVSFGGPIGL